MKKLFWANLIILVLSSCVSTPEGVQIYNEYYNLGNAFFDQKDYSNAIKYYVKALEGDLELNKARYNLAQSYIKESRYDEALVQLDLMSESNQNNLKIKKLYAYLNYKLNNLEKSFVTYKELYELGDKSEETLKNLAVISYLNQDYTTASLYISELLADVDNKDYYYMAGVISEANSDYESAITFYKLSLDKGNLDLTMLDSMKIIYEDLEDFENLKLILELIIDNSSKDVELKSESLFNLAKIYLLNDKNFSEGYSILEKSLNEGFSNSAEALELLNKPDLMEVEKIRSLLIKNEIIE